MTREYLTPADYERALENGISNKLLGHRFRTGMSKERAITQKKQIHKSRKKWHKLMKKNKISSATFQNRVSVLGWDEERAATQKVEKTNIKDYWDKRGRTYPLELIELAKSNDISYDTLRKRITVEEMDPIEAATKPVRKYKKRGEKE